MCCHSDRGGDSKRVGSGAEGVIWAHKGDPSQRAKERESITIQEESQAGSTQLRAGCGCDLRVPEVRPPEGSVPPDPCPGDLPLPSARLPVAPAVLCPQASWAPWLARDWLLPGPQPMGDKDSPGHNLKYRGLWRHRGQRSGVPWEPHPRHSHPKHRLDSR